MTKTSFKQRVLNCWLAGMSEAEARGFLGKLPAINIFAVRSIYAGLDYELSRQPIKET